MEIEAILEDLNPEQYEAVTHEDGVVVVLAGPGSGKTRVITRRVALLAACRGVPAEHILAVTFTNKAAQEMRERVMLALGEKEGALPTISTFHSACVRILRRHGAAVGIPRSFSILDTADSRKLLRQLLTESSMPNEPQDVKTALSSISRYKNGTGDGSDVGPVLEAYMERCRLLGAVDFDDLLLLARRALEENDNVRQECNRRWRHLLVDEYQDTNPTQARLVQLLADAVEPQVCVVGDADQAIYGFRNASPKAFDDLLDIWPQASVIRLDRNYRSSPQIVGVCQALLEGEQENEALRMSMRSERAGGERPSLVALPDDREEARYVVSSIASRSRRAAILVRTNAQTRLFEEELARRRIPYQIVGTLRYYDRAEVKDAIAWLRCALNKDDLLAFERTFGSIPQGVGKKTVEKLLQRAREGIPLEESAEELPKSRKEAVLRVLHLLGEIGVAAEDGPAAAIREVLHNAGLLEHHRRGEGGAERSENLEELLSAAQEGHDLKATEIFLQEILLASDDEGDANADVLLMTAHAAKGREFPEVYVCGIEDGLFPHSQTRGDKEQNKEEKRLLYVACSRAEDRLTLTLAGRRFVHGEVRIQEPSPFLEHIDHLVTSRNTLKGVRARYASGASGSPSRITPGSSASAQRSYRAPAGPRLPSDEAEKGLKVRHVKFGEGEITCVHPGSDTDVTVAFLDGSKRILRLSLAPLEILG